MLHSRFKKKPVKINPKMEKVRLHGKQENASPRQRKCNLVCITKTLSEIDRISI